MSAAPLRGQLDLVTETRRAELDELEALLDEMALPSGVLGNGAGRQTHTPQSEKPSGNAGLGASGPPDLTAHSGAGFTSNPQNSIPIPPELIEEIAQRAAEIAAHRAKPGSPWLTLPEAAEHIRAPKSRLYALVSKRAIPHEKDGSRLLFHRAEIDAWLRSGGATRP